MRPALPRVTVARLFRALCAGFAAVICACFQTATEHVAGGGGIETTDGEVAALAGPASGVRVRMVPDGYSPMSTAAFPAALSTLTDASGHFTFQHLPPGRYNLEAFNPKDGTRLFSPGVGIESGTSRTLPAGTLSRPGGLRLLWQPSHRGYLFFPGTTLIHHITTTEIETPSILFDSLPAGTLPPLHWSESAADTIGKAITDSIAIRSDSITECNVFAAWSFHGRWDIDSSLFANSPAAGLDSFPMLVRLEGSGFDFRQAAADGRDLRFSDAEGKSLPYEIERWDPASLRAEIWVRLGLDSSGKPRARFFMHWGNPLADAGSRGSAVFGIGNGYAAAWHLSETPNSQARGYLDATGSGRDGTGVGMQSAPVSEGLIARAQRLDGVAQRILVSGTFPAGKAPRCLSAWEKSAEPDSEGHLMGYGTASEGASFGAWNDGGIWTAWHWGPSSDLHTSVRADTAWHHVAVDYDGAKTRFYLDGAQIQEAPRDLATGSGGFIIGSSNVPDRYWTGLVDEVQASLVSRPPAWIRAAYLSQKPGSTALRFVILP